MILASVGAIFFITTVASLFFYLYYLPSSELRRPHTDSVSSDVDWAHHLHDHAGGNVSLN